ncbi:EAL domain-containing protein [Marinobacter algicola]|uniref:GGDEF domain/EAL domain protein n=1 Tax=Marinobacter algicola DG893 TaxID=443152 RepID=A6F3Z3_9GAMM|nr:EAL domain-containing protein [Marinobacter algicola]EDM46516.1 GGDEF domain/EAL domain protein [Marinobacter algicola DG893]
MDSTGPQTTQEIASTPLPFDSANGFYHWLPLIVLLFAIAYGWLLASQTPQALGSVRWLAGLETGLPQDLMALVRQVFIGGILAFALLFNLAVVFMLRRPGLAWLSVFMAGVLHCQLVLEQFGLWFIWPDQPQYNALLHISLPLCLIALCEFTPHFLPLGHRSRRIIHVISLLAFLHLLATPMSIPGVGEASFLALALAGGGFILLVVLSLVRQHVHARYYGLAILAILIGTVISFLHTKGWAPSTSFAESAFFLGAAAGSVILTTGAASLLSSAGGAPANNNRGLSVYAPAITERQNQQQRLMLEVENSLASNSMWLEYQPKVRIRDAKVRSVEALIRWHHPEFGYVSPDRWIPQAEEAGVIYPVTLWVIERACSEYRHLTARYGNELAVAVNISATDLTHAGFEQDITDIITRHKLEAKDLILEITETAMMTDPEASRRMIHSLHRKGFRIAMDDFGTGHSSLGTLASFELDELKIDRSFLKGILDHPARQRVFRATLELGEALDLDVVVEGVEDEAVVHWLQQFPDLHGQGFFWGRPEPACP